MRDASTDRLGYWLLAGSLGVVQFNLLTAQVLFGVAALLWLAATIKDGGRPAAPAFFVPLLGYSAWTLVSAAASAAPIDSFVDSKQLLLFLMVPMVVRFVPRARAAQVIDVVIALGAAGALVGIVQYAVFGYDDLNNRPVGALSHYMTYSGVLMLVTCAAVARLLFFRKEWLWPAIAVPALLVALAATFARNAWVGTAAAVASLLAWRNWRLLILAPVLAGLFLALAPGGIRDRAFSIFDRNDPTNRDRIAMVAVGAGMIRDHPIVGVGPDMVKKRYAHYRPDYAVNAINPHLHNVPLQIAAERGLPALGLFLWFVVVAGRDLLRQLRDDNAAVAATGTAALVAMLVAGLFEYNFGDSEFLMLLLGLLTLPFTKDRTPDSSTPHAVG